MFTPNANTLSNPSGDNGAMHLAKAMAGNLAFNTLRVLGNNVGLQGVSVSILDFGLQVTVHS